MSPIFGRMPRLPSLVTLAADAASTARRFPFVLFAAALAALAATLATEDIGPEALQLRLLAAAALAIPLCASLAISAEGAAWKPASGLAFQALGLAVCGAFFAAWPDWSEVLRATRFWELMTAFALAITVARFLRSDRPIAFWQFNAALLVRALSAAIATGGLFVGLAPALLALGKLFGGPGRPRGLRAPLVHARVRVRHVVLPRRRAARPRRVGAPPEVPRRGEGARAEHPDAAGHAVPGDPDFVLRQGGGHLDLAHRLDRMAGVQRQRSGGLHDRPAPAHRR